MKAIVVHQPWATLIALGVKGWETRGNPPHGPMRPEGVRGLPPRTDQRTRGSVMTEPEHHGRFRSWLLVIPMRPTLTNAVHNWHYRKVSAARKAAVGPPLALVVSLAMWAGIVRAVRAVAR